MAHCTGGSCKQGRANCETPWVCEVAQAEPEITEPANAIVTALLIAICLLAVLCAVLPQL